MMSGLGGFFGGADRGVDGGAEVGAEVGAAFGAEVGAAVGAAVALGAGLAAAGARLRRFARRGAGSAGALPSTTTFGFDAGAGTAGRAKARCFATAFAP